MTTTKSSNSVCWLFFILSVAMGLRLQEDSSQEPSLATDSQLQRDKRDLYIGAALHYDCKTLTRIIASFMEVTKPGQYIALLVDANRRDKIRITRTFDRAILIPVEKPGSRFSFASVKHDMDEDLLKVYWKMQTEIEVNATGPKHRANPAFARFALIKSWLVKHHQEYDRIITSDTRDVLFQSDPFQQLDGSTDVLYSFTEPVTYSYPLDLPSAGFSSTLNGEWIQACYGKQYLQSLASNKTSVTCVGVIAGTSDNVMRYFDFMVKEIETRLGCHSQGLDTAAHRYVMDHMGGNVSIQESTTSLITHQFGDNFTAKFAEMDHSENGHLVRNNNGVPYAMIHQADRYETQIWNAYIGKFDKTGRSTCAK